MLVAAYNQGVSDISLQSNQPVWVEAHGRLHRFSDRIIKENDLRLILNFLYDNNALSILVGGADLDFRYDIVIDRSHRIGFRCNITAGRVPGGTGFQATLRTIPGTPPTLEELKVTEPEILENLSPLQGMVLLVGVTGSGKSTLLAATMRHKLEHEDSRKIVTYEAPIEFVYDKIQSKNSFIWQTEAMTHLRVNNDTTREGDIFAYCVSNALRRKPSDILIGEARDTSTIKALIEASLTGHTTYSTVHAGSVSETISRLILKFPPESRTSIACDLINVLRLIVVQKLERTVDGKRVALREYCSFSSELRDRMLAVEPEKIPALLKSHVKEQRHTMYDAAKTAYEAGQISAETFKFYQWEFE